MKSKAIALSLLAVAAASPTLAGGLPEIKTSAANRVPDCATPGRLMTFLGQRNAKLDSRFSGIATEYMRHGESLGLRWDVAFFQMLVETGNLGFTGTVKPGQNNFAGLGATGGGERGESFKDVSAGVRAHLEHVLMYTGEHIENPVAERTRKIQEWGVLTKWQKSIKGPMTFTQLTKQWAPGSGGYRRDIESVSEAFYGEACKQADPRPELVAEARAGRDATTVKTASAEASPPPAAKSEDDGAEKTSGAEIARRAVAEARSEGQGRSSLGASAVAKAEPASAPADAPSFKILNGSAAEPAPAQAPASLASASTATATPASQAKPATASATSAAAPDKEKRIEVALAAEAARPAVQAPAARPSKCNVWTASYGGQKAIIIKAVTTESTNYTVLDVNDGAEKREAEAYIAAYAKGGEVVGEFGNQTLALDKAFDLCPEG